MKEKINFTDHDGNQVEFPMDKIKKIAPEKMTGMERRQRIIDLKPITTAEMSDNSPADDLKKGKFPQLEVE